MGTANNTANTNIDKEKKLIVSVAEMRAADRYTIDELGVPSIELMKRAARGVYDAVEEAHGWAGFETVIFCGSGNNGGDGYALAEIMKDNGLDPLVVRVSGKFSDDGKYYCDRCVEKGVRIEVYGEDRARQDGRGADTAGVILVDCMLGTGFSGVPRAPIDAVINEIDEAGENGAYVVAVDINSGMNGDTGEAELAVKSDLTVSIGAYKTGFFEETAGQWIGDLVNKDIGIVFPGRE